MIFVQDEGCPLFNGLNIMRRTKYRRGFIFKLGRWTFGLRWQSELRRLYWRWNGATRVLYGRDRYYGDDDLQALADRIRIGIKVGDKFTELR